MSKIGENKEKAMRIIRNIFAYLVIIVISFICSYMFSVHVAFLAFVPSESMSSTLYSNDRLIVSRLEYKMNPVQRGDIIVFNSDQLSEGKDVAFVKRVIGISGDVVDIRKGVVYINGKKTVEKYAELDTYSGKFKVPKGHVFVMGDNRDESYDSRFWKDPYVDEGNILGEVCYKFYPNYQKLKNG